MLDIKTISKTVVISALLYSVQAINISAPTPYSNIVAGSNMIVSWTNTNIPRFDIQLKKYTDNHNNLTVAQLASNIETNSSSHLVHVPMNLSTAPILYQIVIATRGFAVASVGPLGFVLPKKKENTPSISMVQQPSSTLVAPLLIAPIETLNIDNPNVTKPTIKDYGFTVSSEQVAGVSMCIVAVSSFIICVYTIAKSYIVRRRASRRLVISEDSTSQISKQPSNPSFVANRLKSPILRNISEEDIIYENMFHDHHYTDEYGNASYHLTPSSRQMSPSPTHRLSGDSHMLGQPSQNLNAFYADLPLPPRPLYGSHVDPGQSNYRTWNSPYK